MINLCERGETVFLCWQGIVGGTYDRYLEGESAVSKPESQLYLPPDVSLHTWHPCLL